MLFGRALHRLASARISTATRERVIDAQLADFQHEWLNAEGFTRRGLVLVRGYSAFWSSLGFCVVRRIDKQSALFVGRFLSSWLFAIIGVCAFAAIRGWIATGSISSSDLVRATRETRIVESWPWTMAIMPFGAQKHFSFLVSRLLLAVGISALVRVAGLGDPDATFGFWLTWQLICFSFGLGVLGLIKTGYLEV